MLIEDTPNKLFKVFNVFFLVYNNNPGIRDETS